MRYGLMTAVACLMMGSTAYAAGERWEQITSTTYEGAVVRVYVDTITIRTENGITAFWTKATPHYCGIFNKKSLLKCETKTRWKARCADMTSMLDDWVVLNVSSGQNVSGKYPWTGFEGSVPDSTGEVIVQKVCSRQ